MPAIRLSVFAGMFPLRSVRLLPDEAAADAVNVDIASGVLRGLQAPQAVFSLDPATESVFRIATGTASDLGSSIWMQFTDPNTDVARSPIVNDSFDRYYWASPTTGPRMNTRARIAAGQPSYVLGVKRPTTTPTVTPAGSPSPIETRSYVVTFRSSFGEEGPPSAPVEATGAASGTWALTNIPQPDGDVNFTPITAIVIYRTITSSAGVSVFFRVAEVAVGVTSYNDTISSTIVSGQGQLLSNTWVAPPSTLQGLIAMPNGILVGFVNNTLYFSENYRPHAWPAEYALTTEYPIVGLGVFGNTCVVATTGKPAAVTGVKSASMNLVSFSTPSPCVSRASVVSAKDGVYFAGENGLVLIDMGGVRELTEGFIGRDRWAEDYVPSSIKAMFVDGRYVATRLKGSELRGFVFRTDKLDDGVSWLDDATLVTARSFRADPWSSKGIYVAPDGIGGRRVYQWRPSGGSRQTYRWRSKEFLLPRPLNMAAAQVFFEPITPAPPELGRLRVWADKRLVYDQPFTTDQAIIRLPNGFMAAVWQVEVQSSLTITAVHMATTVTELRSVA